MRFLFAWQHVEPGAQLIGPEGLRAVVDAAGRRGASGARVGTRRPAGARRALRPGDARHAVPDGRGCLGASIEWSDAGRRRHADCACISGEPAEQLTDGHRQVRPREPLQCSPEPRPTQCVLEHLRARGASFATELESACGLTEDEVRTALTELVAAGAVSSDGFAGLRTIIGTRPTTATGRWFVVNAVTPRSRRLRGRCCAGTAWCSARCSRERRRASPGASWCRCTGDWRRAARSAAADSSTGCRANSSRCPTQSSVCAKSRRTPRGRSARHDQRRRPAQPHRHHHARRSPPHRRRQPHRLPARRAGVGDGRGHAAGARADVDPAIAPTVAAAAAGRRVPVLSGYVGRLSR